MSDRPASEKEERGITAIGVSGFKSLCEKRRIEVRPLTILAGVNSSGKTSIMQPLLLLKQTLEAPYDPGALLLNGPNVQFTAIEQFLSKPGKDEVWADLVVELETDGVQSIINIFRKSPRRREMELVEMVSCTRDQETVLRSGMEHEEIVQQIPEEVDRLRKEFQERSAGEFQWRVVRNRCFLGLDFFRVKVEERPESSVGLLVSPSGWLSDCVRELIHVPGLRRRPERNYPLTTATGPEFQGTFENYVASVIHHWQETGNKRLDDLADALKTLGLTWKVTTELVDDTQVELRVGRLPRGARGGARDVISIADVGLGVSQVLPVLVALLVAQPGQLVFLEQPELHLHPRAQSALAQILAEAANRGVRVVAETHSQLLVLGVQSLVAEGKLAPEKVKLHWFERREDGVTDVISADLDETGAFGDWPEDFAEVELETQSRYLDAVELHQIGG